MSELNLLIFGCAVSFIAVAGAYVYLRECYIADEETSKARHRATELDDDRFRDVA